jgi:[ribosomal protein S5]-alanine N-acetyltransferase
MKPEIITDILKLKLAEISDAENLFQLRTHPEVTRLIKRPPIKDVAEVVQFIQTINANLNNTIFFTINMLNNDELIGSIGLKRINIEQGYAEVGYELFPVHQNKGIMNNALKAVLSFASDELGIHYVEAYTHKDNSASRKLLDKVGFKQVEDKIDPNNLDNVVYGRACSN